ncbi:ribonuclease Y [Helicobacter cynogastricus]|uniref:ribonuclease Y n=1 Tax=Helicobacter cynogastricus TaxID=329937 RepID=UPI000CF0A1A1|nr:ribonuclease Y [Helicobacter cynogastricus]
MPSIFTTTLLPCLLTAILSIYLSRKFLYASSQNHLKQAKIKADMLLYQAQVLYQTKEVESQTLLERLQHDFDQRIHAQTQEYQDRLENLKSQEKHHRHYLHTEQARLEQARLTLEKDQQDLENQKNAHDQIRLECEALKIQMCTTLEQISGYTQEEAKALLLHQLEEELLLQKAALVRRYEKEAKKEARKKANFVIADATARFASNFAMENLTSAVSLPDSEFIGRIIGKEGKNIDSFKRVCGVEVMIDEESKNIILSCFNLYRREIARRTLEELIQDGRIQPARIEMMYQRVEANMEEAILQDAQEVLLELKLDSMHEELKRLIGKMRYRTSYGQNALMHSIEVATLAGDIAAQLGGDSKLARRAGILHDIGKALTYECGGDHVELGAEVCTRHHEHPVVINAIYAHHDREEIKSIECAAVCAADALSATRPGARRKDAENFLVRMHELERIATKRKGVKKVFAMDAGREVRVIVCPERVNDSKIALLARDIAKEIETTLQYPGEVVVHVIREKVAKATAR